VRFGLLKQLAKHETHHANRSSVQQLKQHQLRNWQEELLV
jgi:hypothetical protein